MSFKRFWILFVARNREFFRDRAAFGWNFLFPFLLVAGFGLIFGGKVGTPYKVGIFPWDAREQSLAHVNIPERFRQVRNTEFLPFASRSAGIEKLRRHKIDFLLQAGPPPYRYWINDSSPKGYVLEQIFSASVQPEPAASLAQRQTISGREIRYIDFLFPGILGMNMMFSALWGVGYVVVRYRKNGVLKRLKVTPLTALEYLSAQMVSRMFLLIFTLSVVWFGSDLIFHFHVAGSYVDLFIVWVIGSLSLTSLGLLLAARGTSEEFTTGALNFISWPMMFLSEVWFSLEGAPRWIQTAAQIFPLTHLLRAVRKIMNDGAGLVDVSPEIAVMVVMTLLFLSISAAIFSWTR